MQIRTIDDRVLSGTPLQIVQSMRDLSMMPQATIAEYIDHVLATASMMQSGELNVELIKAHRDNEEQQARVFIDEMRRIGLVHK